MPRIIRVGVLRGGPSSEYEVSLKTGAAILETLRNEMSDRYDAVDVLIDKSGIWYVNGVPFEPRVAKRHFDIAVNALHGQYGEDGKIQHILESHDVPFTGSGSLSSAVGMNKILTKKALKDHNIKSPYWKEILSKNVERDPVAEANELFNTFLFPAIVKPTGAGSSVGVSKVSTQSEIVKALMDAAAHGDSIIVEEFIPGIESTCGVIEGFRGEHLYSLPAVEIRHKKPFFDYESKYTPGMSEEIVPATFPLELRKKIEALAKEVHQTLRLRHYSRTDFIIHPRRGIYVLETNTLPGLTNESILPKSLRSVGSSLAEFVDHIIKLAMGKHE